MCIEGNFDRIENYQDLQSFGEIKKEVDQRIKCFGERKYWIKFYHKGLFYKDRLITCALIEALNDLKVSFKHLLKFKESYSNNDYICSIVANRPKKESIGSIISVVEYLYDKLEGDHINFSFIHSLNFFIYSLKNFHSLMIYLK